MARLVSYFGKAIWGITPSFMGKNSQTIVNVYGMRSSYMTRRVQRSIGPPFLAFGRKGFRVSGEKDSTSFSRTISRSMHVEMPKWLSSIMMATLRISDSICTNSLAQEVVVTFMFRKLNLKLDYLRTERWLSHMVWT